jgi:hypothetical protein
MLLTHHSVSGVREVVVPLCITTFLCFCLHSVHDDACMRWHARLQPSILHLQLQIMAPFSDGQAKLLQWTKGEYTGSTTDGSLVSISAVLGELFTIHNAPPLPHLLCVVSAVSSLGSPD